jgi:FkbM family methyltransferase
MNKAMNRRLKLLLLLATSLVILNLIIMLYHQYKMNISTVMEARLIDNSIVMLDRRVNQKHGSYSGHSNLYDPHSVTLVYSELQNRLQTKQQVVLLDIGANTGSFALLPTMSKKIKVFAFEPNLEVADILRTNVKLNNITDNVTVLPIGISNKTAIVDLHIPTDKRSGLATLGTNILRFASDSGYSSAVYVTSLDEIAGLLLKNDEAIDVVKIDTEGWEYYILLGAIKTLQAHRPAILLEFNETNMQQTGVNSKDLLSLLDKLQYTCTKLPDDLFCQPNRDLQTHGSS